MKNAHSPNKQNERPDNAILVESRNAAIDFRFKHDAPAYPNRAERRAITKSFNKESIADLDLIREGSPEAMRLMSTLPALLKNVPFELAIEACKWTGNIQLRHGYDHATKKQTAIHEAGHIVAVQALGIQATSSRIWWLARRVIHGRRRGGHCRSTTDVVSGRPVGRRRCLMSNSPPVILVHGPKPVISTSLSSSSSLP